MGKHAAAPTPQPRPTSGPKHAAPRTPEDRAADANAVVSAGTRATAAAPRRAKPSTLGSAASGAAGGATAGAALGSVVPGVGTAIGGATGAALGAAGGVVKGRREKRAWRAEQGGPARRILIMELLVCVIVLALSPLSQPEGAVSAKDWMKRGTAVSVLFMILGMMASAGPRAGKVAASFGGIVTLVLLVDQRSIFALLADKLKNIGTGGGSAPLAPGGSLDILRPAGSAGPVPSLPGVPGIPGLPRLPPLLDPFRQRGGLDW